MKKLANALLSLVILLTASTVFARALAPEGEAPPLRPDRPPVAAQEISGNEEVLSNPMAEEQIPQVKTEPVTSRIDQASEVKPYDENNLPKEPLPEPKSEFQKLMAMFLKMMLSVIVAAVVIFILAVSAKKFQKNKPVSSTDEEMKDNLKSSQTDAEALRSFLNKTKNN